MDHAIVGGIVNSLPIDKMVAAPVMAAVQAQTTISASLAEFIEDVGLDKNGNVRMVTFKYGENTIKDGKPEQEDRFIQAPFLALTGVPNFAMEEVNVSFELEVNTVEQDKSTTATSASTDITAKSLFSPISAKFTGSVSHSSEQTRQTDTRAKYVFNVSARRQGPPEGLMRMIDAVTNATAQPSTQQPKNYKLLENPIGQQGQQGQQGQKEPENQ